ncbi:hypothetical protein P154DRAFT_535654 [Amniculicola lignicola CBS 123094]|uniref:Uncharacterized protein n=1 Tax=Amniculicola lignicola CBS 123094 TaxID=1392246 RepID=A0A6A5WDJ3_9PLEO|nr:hypothetical protein P154DRAFT_535654 [Amniculicola lignicola CBS 123094]
MKLSYYLSLAVALGVATASPVPAGITKARSLIAREDFGNLTTFCLTIGPSFGKDIEISANVLGESFAGASPVHTELLRRDESMMTPEGVEKGEQQAGAMKRHDSMMTPDGAEKGEQQAGAVKRDQSTLTPTGGTKNGPAPVIAKRDESTLTPPGAKKLPIVSNTVVKRNLVNCLACIAEGIRLAVRSDVNWVDRIILEGFNCYGTNACSAVEMAEAVVSLRDIGVSCGRGMNSN